jgi:hypothetical protein
MGIASLQPAAPRIDFKSPPIKTGSVIMRLSLSVPLSMCALLATTWTASPVSAELLYGLTTSNSITVFNSSAPNVAIDGGFVDGLVAGEELIAIDFRPGSGQIYLLGSSETLYTFDLPSLDATAVGNFSATADLRGTSFAFDFNPMFNGGEFARIISGTDHNRVISGNTGQYLLPVDKTKVFYAAGDPNEGANPNIAGIAYTNSLGVPTSTQQYGIDATLGVLTTVANNAGTLQTVGSLGIAGSLTNELGFDISGATGIGYASLQTGPNSQLYRVDLGTGAATLLGTFTSGDLIRDITVIPVAIPEPSSALLAGMLLSSLMIRRRRQRPRTAWTLAANMQLQNNRTEWV